MASGQVSLFMLCEVRGYWSFVWDVPSLTECSYRSSHTVPNILVTHMIYRKRVETHQREGNLLSNLPGEQKDVKLKKILLNMTERL